MNVRDHLRRVGDGTIDCDHSEAHQEPYLRTIFGSFGIQDIQFVNASNLVLSDREQSISAAQAKLQTLAAQW